MRCAYASKQAGEVMEELMESGEKQCTIPSDLVKEVLRLHGEGKGYRTISFILRNQHGANVTFSAVRMCLKRASEQEAMK